jgi:hypothetical protein
MDEMVATTFLSPFFTKGRNSVITRRGPATFTLKTALSCCEVLYAQCENEGKEKGEEEKTYKSLLPMIAPLMMR